MAVARVKLSSKNQITVPADVRKRLNVHAQESIEFVEVGDNIVVKRVEEPRSFLDMRGILPPLKDGDDTDFDQAIYEAMEERTDEIMRRIGDR